MTQELSSSERATLTRFGIHHEMVDEPHPVGERVWYHTTKGRIVGVVVGQQDDPEWVHVRLTESAWADVRHRHMDDPGTVQTYRRSRMVEMVATPSAVHVPASPGTEGTR